MEGNILGNELKRLRKEKKFSQKDVAERLHIIRQTYSHYETGRVQPPVRKLYDLAAIYEIPISVLLCYMDNAQIGEMNVVLSQQENEMLRYYRRLNKRDREDMLQLIKNRAGGGKTKKRESSEAMQE